MTDPQRRARTPRRIPRRRRTKARTHEMEEYAGGYIQARVGHIPAWLLAVYTVLFIWALYYGFTYWGGVRAGTAILVKRRNARSTR